LAIQLFLKMSQNTIDKGKISWQSPSNIALIKYWGKHGTQLPCNPSVSMTLSASITNSSISYLKKQHADKSVVLEFYFDGKRSEAFEKRIAAYFHHILDEFPFLTDYQFKIESSNTFPHSSGIASSASAFSALALCIMSLKEIVTGALDKNAFYQQASQLARLGSGSAARSVFGGYTIWGQVEGMDTYSDIYARPLLSEIHPSFQSYHDAVLIVSEKNKKIGSSAGHALMEKNPFAEARYRQAMDHTIEMLQVLKTGDAEKFVKIVEQEAMTLHGLMMSSDPGYVLMKQGTIEIMDRIRDFREKQQIPVAFTLDAGPNVHLLYPSASREKVLNFINEELLHFCNAKQWIDDAVGKGPKLMNA
jgi:diphosphomevalonate decarboxylase